MNVFKLLFFSCFVCGLSAVGLSAQSPISIVEHIRAGHVNTVTQPDSLNRLLAPPALQVAPAEQSQNPEGDADDSVSQVPAATKKIVGFRVQVFSDNNPRTAKNEARTKQRSISSRFPQYRTYVTYTSPYWRLKVGDFRSQNEANEAAEELRRQFPSYSKEIRVVRDRINVSN